MKKLKTFKTLTILFSIFMSLFTGSVIASVTGLNPIATGGVLFVLGTLVKVPHGSFAMALSTAGDFTVGDLYAIQGTAERIWADNAAKSDYVAQVGVLEAMRKKQTAQLTFLENPEKDREVQISWLALCDTVVAAVSDDCVVGGDELVAGTKNYALDLEKTIGFSVAEKKMRTSIFSVEEQIARGTMKCLKQLDEYLAQTAVAKLNAFAGTNVYETGLAAGVGFDTINPAYWTADLFSEFALLSIKNQFSSPSLISGINLWKEGWKTSLEAANADGKGGNAKFNTMAIEFDLFNIDSVNAGSKLTYLIDSGAVAFSSKVYSPTTPVVYNGTGLTKYSIASRNLSGVSYDVVYTTTCVANETYHHWSFYVKAGIFSNPTGCNETKTGVLAFINA